MAKQIKRLLPVRVRKGELSQSKFTCPFLKKNGQQCKVLQPYRNLTDHCRKMHDREISLRCEVDECGWECHISLRCLTSHRSNLETHGVLVFSGGQNADGTCKVVPYVEEEQGALECHTDACCVTTLELTKFRAKMLKREERANAKLPVPEDEFLARAWRMKFGSKSEAPSMKEFLARRAAAREEVVKPVVAGVEPEVAGVELVQKSEKDSFSSFNVQFRQLAAKGQEEFDWEAFNKILKAKNMQVSAESLK